MVLLRFDDVMITESNVFMMKRKDWVGYTLAETVIFPNAALVALDAS
jgi:hypothetical protein